MVVDTSKGCGSSSAARSFHFAGYSDNNDCILGTRSGILKGFVTTVSMPASMAMLICSLRALAVMAMTGTWLRMWPLASCSLIFRTQVRPSITGICETVNIGMQEMRWRNKKHTSRSMRIMESGMFTELEVKTVVWRKSIQSCPWSAVWTVHPSLRSC
jgi:hypothetical protein